MCYYASQAKPDTQRLLEELAELARRPLPERDELSRARLRRRADRLRQADPPGAEMALDEGMARSQVGRVFCDARQPPRRLILVSVCGRA